MQTKYASFLRVSLIGGLLCLIKFNHIYLFRLNVIGLKRQQMTVEV